MSMSVGSTAEGDGRPNRSPELAAGNSATPEKSKLLSAKFRAYGEPYNDEPREFVRISNVRGEVK